MSSIASPVGPVAPVKRSLTREHKIRRRRLRLFPLLVALVGIIATLVLVESGVLQGLAAFGLVAVLLVLIPSARTFSRRIALNGAIALGVVPMLWWFPWPQIAGVSHSGVILGLAVGFILFRLTLDHTSRRGLLPSVAAVDGLPVAVGLFSAWYFLPFFTHSSGVASVSILTQVFGNDNVAHFNMFEMIRRTLTSGPWWPSAPDGSPFAYVWYPQHFHTFSAFVAELWAGTGIGVADVETGLFGIGAVTTMLVGVVVLAAGVSALNPLRVRPGLATVVVAACVSVLLLGTGSEAFPYGFPSFYLAFVVTVLAVVLALNARPTSTVELFAVAVSVIVVAHSWSLLTPIAGIAFVWAAVRLPWASFRKRWVSGIPAVITVFIMAGGVLFALYLVYKSTRSVGSPDAVLSIAGGIPVVRSVVIILIGIALIGITLGAIVTAPEPRIGGRFAGPLTLIGLAGAVGLFEAVALIVIQLGRADQLSYYQLKFLLAVGILFSILLVLAIALWVAETTRIPKDIVGRLLAGVSVAALVVGVVLYSGVPVVSGPLMSPQTSAGLKFRADVYAEAAISVNPDSTHGATSRLSSAADDMANWPCARPIYLSQQSDAGSMDVPNQWAMAMSSTWTQAAVPINRYLSYFNSMQDPLTDPGSMINQILSESPDRCIILSSESHARLDSTIIQKYPNRIFSW